MLNKTAPNHLVILGSDSMDTKQEILRTSYEILGRVGLEGLHARSIATEVGINHATVHYHFRSRRDLLIALVDYAAQRFAQDRQKILRSLPGEFAILEAEVALYEAYCRPQSRFFRVWTSLFVAGQAEDEIRVKLQAFSTVWSTSFASSLERAKEVGVDVAGTLLSDPYVFTATMLGLGLVAQLHGEGNKNAQTFDRIVKSLERT